jgi:hypothetical protein
MDLKLREIIDFYTEGRSFQEKNVFIQRLNSFRDSVPKLYDFFLNLNHLDKLSKIQEIYGVNQLFLKKIVYNFPQFLNLDHLKKLDEIVNIYGIEKSLAKKIVLSYPQFLDLNHKQKLIKIKKIYGIKYSLLKKIVLSYPQFIGVNHSQVIDNIKKLYGVDSNVVKRAILFYPQFVGRNQENIIRINLRLGKLLGLSEKFIREQSLKNLQLNISNPYKKIAFIDVLRKIGFDNNIFKILDQKINSKFYKLNNRFPTNIEIIELKAESIFSWLNNKAGEKKYSPFIKFNDMPKDMREKIKNVEKRVIEMSKKTKYALPGVREGVIKKHYKGKTESKLEPYLKKAQFRVPKKLTGKKR